MNRRGFLSALGALATTSVLPTVPSIPLGTLYDARTMKILFNSIYGKTLQTVYGGGRREYYRAGSAALRLVDIRSAYPKVRG